jgi:hypothetical protein
MHSISKIEMLKEKIDSKKLLISENSGIEPWVLDRESKDLKGLKGKYKVWCLRFKIVVVFK